MTDRSRQRDRPDLGVAPESASAGDCSRGAWAVFAGRYELGVCLHSSSESASYEAFDRDRQCSVVVHRSSVVASAQSQDELVARLQSLLEFRHPNVVPLVDAGLERDECFLVRDPTEGDLLADLLPASGPLDAETASGLATQICDALSAGHQRGLRHGGLSPEQILITDSGDAVLLGFGWSDVAPSAADSTSAWEFTAPEQRTERRAGDQRSDLWSLGAVLCSATTGSAPPVPHPELIPEPLRRPVLQALAEDPDRRIRSAAEFRAALEPGLAPDREDLPAIASAARAEPDREAVPAAAGSNLFFPLVIAAGALFVVTILALIATPFGDPEAPVAQWLERYAWRLIVGEVLLILVLGFLALLVDRRRAMRRLVSDGIGSPVALRSAGQGPTTRQVGQNKPAAARPE